VARSAALQRSGFREAWGATRACLIGASAWFLGCGPADGVSELKDAPPVAPSFAGLAAAPSAPACYGASGLQAQAPWPMVGLCPAHRARTPVVATQSNARAPGFSNGVWLRGAVTGSPAIAADGTVYAGSPSRFFALNPSGSVKWSVTSGIGAGASPAIGADGSIFMTTAGTASVVRALRPTTGSTKWSFSIGGTVSSGPALSADGATLYVTSQNGKLVALNAANGQARWTLTRAAIWTSPAIGVDGTVYVGADDGLHAVDPATGATKWSRSFGSGGFVRSSPAIAGDGTIYVGTDLGRLEATKLDGSAGFSFTAPGIGIIRSAPALGSDATIYFGSRDRKLYAVDPSGASKWAFITGGNVDSSPAVGADGTVYVGSDDRKLYALRPDGTQLFAFTTGGSVRGATAIGRNGTVFAGSDDQRIWAFGPGPCQAADTTCDSRDDDCNGSVDEDFPSVHTTCGSGASLSSGDTSCVGSAVLDSCRAGGAVAQQPGATELVGRWSFDEGTGVQALDSSGFGNHGVVTGAAREARGRAGGCLRFDSTSSFVTVPDGVWNKGTSVTYSLWYKSEGSPVGTVLEHQHTSALAGAFSVQPAGIGFVGYDSTTRSFSAQNYRPAPPGVWTMVTAVVGSSEVKLYKDGVFAASAPITGGIPYRPGALFIGARGEVLPNGDNHFRGLVDEVSIYGHAFSDAEVLALYQSYAPIADDRPDLVAHYAFDEGTGSVLTDSSGLGNNGQIRGALWAPTGASGGSLYFNGTDAMVTVPDGTWENGTPVTYVAWYKTDGAPKGFVFEHQLGSNIPGAFALAPGRSAFIGYDSRNVDTAAAYPGVPSNTWTMIATTITDTEVRVYRDGVFVRAVPIGGGFPYTAAPFHIGARGGVPDSFFKGWIDEISIYRRALAAGEVLELFQRSHTCKVGECSAVCPCKVGSQCDPSQENGFCEAGLTCEVGVGDVYGLSPMTPVCWSPICDDPSSPDYRCGSTSAPCGLCQPICVPDCAGKTCGDDGCGGVCGSLCAPREQGCTSNRDCTPGHACGADNGERMGLPAGSRACWPVYCDVPASGSASCGAPSAPCGVCPICVPDCAGRCGGDDGCGGECHGDCPEGAHCSHAGVCQRPGGPSAHPLPEGTDRSTAAVGTLPGHFQVTDDGDADYRIPLAVPPGVGGVEPVLALRYNSSVPNGYFGIGWYLEGLSTITRCNRTIAQDGFTRAPETLFTDAYCLDGRRLEPDPSEIARFQADGTVIVRYRLEEEAFTRVEVTFEFRPEPQTEILVVTGPRSFKVFGRDGRISEYGTEDKAKILGNPVVDARGNELPPQPIAWFLSSVRDRAGNVMRVQYAMDSSALGGEYKGRTWAYAPAAIIYGPTDDPIVIRFDGSNHPEFDEPVRSDPIVSFRNGALTQFQTLLRKIGVVVGGREVRKYFLDYDTPASPAAGTFSRLARVTDCDGGGVCKPPTRFAYQVAELGLNSAQPLNGGVSADKNFPQHVLDFNGDGFDDILYATNSSSGCVFGSHDFRKWAVSLSKVSVSSPTEWSIGHEAINTGLVTNEADGCDVIGTEIPVSSSGAGGVFDWDNDGRQDFIEYDRRQSGQPNHYTVLSFDGRRVERHATTIPRSRGGQQYLLDIDGDNYTDFLVCDADGDDATWRLYRNRGGASGDLMIHGNHAGFSEADRVDVDIDAECEIGNVVLDKDGDGADELLVRDGATPDKGFFFSFFADGTTRRFKTNHALDTHVTTVVTSVYEDGRPLGSSVASLSRPGGLLLDVNGDGLTDIVNYGVKTAGSNAKAFFGIALNTGEGHFAQVANEEFAISPGGTSRIDMRALAWDADADGLDDILFTVAGPSRSFAPWKVVFSTGVGLTTQGPAINVPAELGTNMLQLVDTDGDGAHGLLGAGVMVSARRGAARDRLAGITDGLGAHVAIRYAALTDPHVYTGEPPDTPPCGFPFLCGPSRRAVVSATFEYDDPFPAALNFPARRYTHEYRGARTDALGRGSLGFSMHTERQLDPTFLAPKRELTTFFDNRTRQDDIAAYPFALKPQRRVSKAFVDRNEFTTDIGFEYEVIRPTAATFAVPVRVKTTRRYATATQTGAEDVLLNEREVVTARDELGHALVTDSFLNFGGEFRRLELSYAHMDDPLRKENWLIDLETLRRETYTVTSSQVVKTRSVESQYYPSGMLLQRTLQPGDPKLQLVEVYARTTHGNLHKLIRTDASGEVRTITTDYDDLDRYPIKTTNPKGQITEVEHERLFGNRIWRRDPNGLVEQSGYDGFGRIRVTIDEAGVPTTTRYAPGSAELPLTIESSTAGGARAIEERDLRNRPAIRRSFGFNGKELVQTHVYDDDGNLADVSRPTAVGTAPVRDKFTIYDNQRRIRRQIGAANETSISCYDVRAACVTNPRGYSRCEVLDDRGRVARSLDPFFSSCTDALAIATAGLGPAVSYSYGAFDDLETITDQKGNRTTITTDDVGNVIVHSDPNSGVQFFDYNGFGELREGSDLEGHHYVLEYDPLGRRIRRTDTGTGSAQTTQWVWDGGDLLEPGEGELIGRLTESTSPDGVTRRYRYFADTGLLKGQSDTIAGAGPFESSFVRDGFGRVTEVHYPAAPGLAEFAVSNVYDTFGHLTEVKSLGAFGAETTYWQALGTDEHDQLSGELFGSFASTQRTYEVHGWPKTIVARTGILGPPAQSIEFTDYDGNGNPGRKLEHVRGQNQSYSYDPADRLLSDSGGSGSTFSYDEIGNIYFNPDVKYELPAPHALSSDGAFFYGYDLNGNRIRKEAEGFLERTSYTQFNKPLEIWNEDASGVKRNAVSFLYDADQARARKQTQTTISVYSRDYERRTPRSEGVSQHVYYIRNSARVVAQAILTEGSTELRMSYLQTDQLGTPTVVTDGAGQVTELDYDVFGQRRDPDWSVSSVPPNASGVSVTFTGHEDDVEHGLINMGGRIYDPRIRQFTSPDPVQRIRSATRINRYLYALGNPLRYLDPSGFNEVDAGIADLESSEYDLSEAEFQSLVTDLAGNFDPATAVPPSIDPLAAMSGPASWFERPNMCLKTAPAALAGTLFALLAHGGNVPPPALPLAPEGSVNICADHQSCLWGDGSVTEPGPNGTYRLARGRLLREYAESLTGLTFSPGTIAAQVSGSEAGGSTNEELRQQNERIKALNVVGDMVDTHHGAFDARRNIQMETQPMNDPVSRPRHVEPGRPDPVQPSLEIMEVPFPL
jgi:RHS repeat-associated protein